MVAFERSRKRKNVEIVQKLTSTVSLVIRLMEKVIIEIRAFNY